MSEENEDRQQDKPLSCHDGCNTHNSYLKVGKGPWLIIKKYLHLHIFLGTYFKLFFLI